ncbi:hypothetical protein ALC53_04766 [Atta colombica]|uniref:Uncharacterized protein n=1 Tax=Atta colombica TaxID=520822 RepID=A0A195BLG9_9HYME|nr:hypothetical protein ALC53_04766 [Atta colombica]
MRHSSSWPDRAPQKVKVRVDPLSRAFTIIPTSRETVYRLEQTAPRSNCLEEVIFLDRCVPGVVTSVMIKRRLIDGRTSINKKSANFFENSDVTNETKIIKNTSRYFMPRSLSLIETTATHQNSVIVLEENIVRNPLKCKSDSLEKINNEIMTRDMKRNSISRTTSDIDFSKLLSKNVHVEEGKEALAQLKNKSPSFAETNAFDVIVNIANESQHTVSIAQTNHSQIRETDEMRKKYQTLVSPTSSTRHTSSPPHIKVVDYDDYVTSMSFSSKNDLHACPKCMSEGVLRSQIDPFRSPSQNKKNDATNARGIRSDLVGREKKEVEKYQSKDIWYADRLIGEARNVDKDDKKLQQQRKNYDLSPLRPAMDFRKEATLRRHYYPEGGWGYVIVTCSVLVHFIGVGLQLAAPGCWHITAELQFRHPPLHSAGMKSNILNALKINFINI